ncbi:MAG: glycine cleavage system aminomethyltransferase GcvT [Alphaproteobacteria bacterium]|nr:glycine cleavage system aminomethyltransferase GcvT [Alphaproteobacteria bacterium]
MTNVTPLHSCHLAAGAKMGSFSGYEMPAHYGEGAVAEHEWVRASCGLFDLSHRGQMILHGNVVPLLHKLTPSEFGAIPEGRTCYTVLTNEKGGIIDDLFIAKLGPDRFFAVLNAGSKEKDFDWVFSHMPARIAMDNLEDQALLGLQGPRSARVLLEALGIDAVMQPHMWTVETELPDGIPVFLTRFSYTGEDGFVLSLPGSKAEALWDRLSRHKAVKPAGFGALDSLRLEMGYCLYGHDIDDTTTPIEAGLDRVFREDHADFIGHDELLIERAEGPARRRVGVILSESGIPLEGADIFSVQNEPIGALTSSGFSPTLKAGIGQGYVKSGYVLPGTQVFVRVGEKKIPGKIVALPFVPGHTKSPEQAVPMVEKRQDDTWRQQQGETRT